MACPKRQCVCGIRRNTCQIERKPSHIGFRCKQKTRNNSRTCHQNLNKHTCSHIYIPCVVRISASESASQMVSMELLDHKSTPFGITVDCNDSENGRVVNRRETVCFCINRELGWGLLSKNEEELCPPVLSYWVHFNKKFSFGLFVRYKYLNSIHNGVFVKMSQMQYIKNREFLPAGQRLRRRRQRRCGEQRRKSLNAQYSNRIFSFCFFFYFFFSNLKNVLVVVTKAFRFMSFLVQSCAIQRTVFGTKPIKKKIKQYKTQQKKNTYVQNC